MFKIEKIKSCPHTRGSKGVVMMTPELLGQIKGAVDGENLEWAMVLKGTKDQEGFLVNVTGYEVPTDQVRSGGNVSLPDVTLDIGGDIVGVIHSHHSMGAFFSGTDEATFNHLFPVSIVVARAKGPRYLGFEYKGTGKVVLPCGSLGEVDFFIQPTEGPIEAAVIREAKEPEKLGDCGSKSQTFPDKWHITTTAKCGLSQPVSLLADAFGSTTEILDEVKAIPGQSVTVYSSNGGYGHKLCETGHAVICKCPKCVCPATKRHICDCLCSDPSHTKQVTTIGKRMAPSTHQKACKCPSCVCYFTKVHLSECKCDRCNPSSVIRGEAGDTEVTQTLRFQKQRGESCEESSKEGKKGGKEKAPKQTTGFIRETGGRRGYAPRALMERKASGPSIFKGLKYCHECFNMVDLDAGGRCIQCSEDYCIQCQAVHQGAIGCQGNKDIIENRDLALEAVAQILEQEPDKDPVIRSHDYGSIVIDGEGRVVMDDYQDEELDDRYRHLRMM